MNEIATFSIFKFDDFKSKFWALSQMHFAHQTLKTTKNQSFYKLMGSGKQGFRPWADFSTFALFQVWDSIEAAEDFQQSSTLFLKYQKNASDVKTYFLQPLTIRGLWNTESIFKPTLPQKPGEKEAIVALTRASIRRSKLLKFWESVPSANAILNAQKHLFYAKGFGELPFVQMATFSHWETHEAMLNYVYHSQGHRNAIQKAREQNFFKEELFATFRILAIKAY
ncbi:MAG: DUF3291 domain-containing protein [Psychroflexus sp.]|nr:DUF3291 domain-containing protein [Psychroflexus sp.]